MAVSALGGAVIASLAASLGDHAGSALLRLPAAAHDLRLSSLLGVAFAALGTIGVMHLVAFVLARGSQAEHLWFGGMTVVFAAGTLAEEVWMAGVAPGSWFAARAAIAAEPLVAVLAIQFLWSLLAVRIGGLLRAYQAFLLTLAGFALMWPDPAVVINVRGLLWLGFVPLMAATVDLMVRAVREGREGARLLAVAILTVVGVEAVELIVIVTRAGTIAPWPTVAFTMAALLISALMVHQAREIGAFKELVMLAPEFVGVLDGEKILLVNDGGAKALGFAGRRELEGRPLTDVVPAYLRDSVGRLARETLAGRRSPTLEELRIVRRDGEPVFMEFSARAGRWRGRAVVLVVGRDVTDRRRAVRQMLDSERKCRQLFETVPVGIYRASPEGRVLEANSSMARILGYADRSDLAGFGVADGVEATPQRRTWQERLEEDGELDRTVRWERADGTPVLVREMARAVRDEAGDLVEIEGTVEDFGHRRQAEERTQVALHRLETLQEVTRGILEARSVGQVVETALGRIRELVQYDRATVFELDSEGETAVVLACQSDRALRLRRGRTFSGAAFTGVELERHGLRITERLAPAAERSDREEELAAVGARSALEVGLVAGGNLLGILSLVSLRESAFARDEVEVVREVGGVLAVALRDARLDEKLRRQATTDPLTGLWNRRHLLELADRELERHRRFDRPFSVIMLDIDHFKRVNDSYGHAVGDSVLQSLVRRCLECVREVDVVGRYGGEEFLIALPETAGAGARQVAERLRTHIAAHAVPGPAGGIPITVSLGVAEAESGLMTIDELIAQADDALYRAKRQGRDRVCGPGTVAEPSGNGV